MIISWKYNNTIVKKAPEGFVAFVYYLEFEDGTKYIGKKNLLSVTRKKITGKARKVKVIKESNWKSYLSSSEIVKRKLKEGERLIKRDIIRWCKTATEATYWEAKLQFDNNVLCDPTYLNGLIYCKIMRCPNELDL